MRRCADSGVDRQLDLIAIGRVSVDLYGQQIGGRLEDVTTFARAVGGCPANVAIGTARLGLKSALISRVGEEAMGGFVREQLAREGVDTRGLVLDRERLTSLVLLSVRDQHTFPLIFYRDNCADSALCEDDIDENFVASAAAILVTGTHFALPRGARAQRKAIELKKAHGGKVILDIDYRPNLWGLGGHAAGASRYARSSRVTEALAAVLPDCDLIVGTEEELHVAAGVENTLEAVRTIRAASSAVIVCKRGAQGCIVFAGRAPERLEDGLVAGGMEVEVYNVLGAGDAFLAGFLRGYLRDEPHEVSARLGNACGAIAVSRLLCSSEFPTLPELNYYLLHHSPRRALRTDPQLNHLHWVTTRPSAPPSLCALDAAACVAAAPDGRRAALEGVLAAAVAQAAGGAAGYGLIGDAATGLVSAGGPLWQARSLEPEGSASAAPGPTSLAVRLIEWPAAFTVRAVYECGADTARAGQEQPLVRLGAACRAQRRELLLELAAGTAPDAADAMARLYALGICPDWWLLPPLPDAWSRCAEIIAAHDEYCRGILVAVEPHEAAALRLAAASPAVRGFTTGRTILAGTAPAWLAGQVTDAAAVADIAAQFGALAAAWTAARETRPPRTEGSSS